MKRKLFVIVLLMGVFFAFSGCVIVIGGDYNNPSIDPGDDEHYTDYDDDDHDRDHDHDWDDDRDDDDKDDDDVVEDNDTETYEIDPERVIMLEQAFDAVLERYISMLGEYNNHLESTRYHPEDADKDRYKAACDNDELTILPGYQMPVDKRLELLDTKTHVLLECLKIFQRKYNVHVGQFHPGGGIFIVQNFPDYDTRNPQAIVEGNLDILARYVVRLRAEYDRHLEEDHTGFEIEPDENDRDNLK